MSLFWEGNKTDNQGVTAQVINTDDKKVKVHYNATKYAKETESCLLQNNILPTSTVTTSSI